MCILLSHVYIRYTALYTVINSVGELFTFLYNKMDMRALLCRPHSVYFTEHVLLVSDSFIDWDK